MQKNYVFVVDQNRQPLNPVTPRQARKLLEKGKAAVLRGQYKEWMDITIRFNFTALKSACSCSSQT